MKRPDPMQASLFGPPPARAFEELPGQTFLPLETVEQLPARPVFLRPGWAFAGPELATRRHDGTTAWVLGYTDGRWAWSIYSNEALPGAKYALAMDWSSGEFDAIEDAMLDAEQHQDRQADGIRRRVSAWVESITCAECTGTLYVCQC